MEISRWLPPEPNTQAGAERRVGVELEFAGLEPAQIIACVQNQFGGKLQRRSSFEFFLQDTSLGKFGIELDAAYIKSLGALMEESGDLEDEFSIEAVATELLTKAAEQFVPWELVTPPVPVSRLAEVQQLFTRLRQAGALGTRNSIRYAFGLHLNPELPNTDIATILAYLRAYLCLYDWIADRDQIDLTRKLTNYIKHFSKEYIQLVVDWDYRPDLAQLIDDYIDHNPTRNRSMDMLPLFTFLDEPRVRNRLDDARIKSRPTLHYRLPNCDIDNPQWNLDQPWQNWLQVERLALAPQRLQHFCARYGEYLDSFFTTPFDTEWLNTSRRLLQEG
ncbi:amidoligase family protein [Ketobacter sp.]|uniref:amidoligase family protein n=1 Tax=Ketobacter sp. TaxID=2083498 RepID=UPI000F0D87E2|nr:amidoligase family protein [Ketobacter sp.]RLU01118.1 MAG: hypothetical protein D9N14_03985 [Ketobacter sp.]